MPELPELETLTRDLRRTVVGKTIVEAFVGQPKAVNVPVSEFRQRVRGRVAGADRKGKSAILHLPDADIWLHLGLRGRVEVVADQPWPAAKFIAFRFADGTQLSIDKVFMGHAHIVPRGANPPGEVLGIDALDPALTVDAFRSLLRKKPGLAVKTALMNQSLIAGIGNTYSDEILLAARIHPARRISSLSSEAVDRLYRAMRDVLEEAISHGGEHGWYDFAGREGGFEPSVHQVVSCGVCEGTVEEIAIGGRTGYYCPACQGKDTALGEKGDNA